MSRSDPLPVRAVVIGGCLLLAAVVVAIGGVGATDSTAASSQYEPQVTTEPSISGTARQGSTLTGNPGNWTSTTPITFAYQWLRCDTNGANCAAVAGATAQTYTLVAADVGRRMRFRVTATNSSGATTKDSNGTAVVAAAGPDGQIRLGDGRVSIPATSVSPPERLVIETAQPNPNPVRSRSPFLLRVRVADTRGYVVRNALVYIVGLPYRRIIQPGEVQTGQDGWATLTIQPTRLLPLQNGATLVLFVRARKAGDNVLTGISTRRLMQIRLGAPR